jgi:hypothetical protein
MTRIVTTTYRYKRPPRKRKAVALEVPAVVTRKHAAGPAKSVKAADRLPEQPANDDRKPATIVSTTSRKRLKLLHAEERSAQRDDDPEAMARVRAFFARNVRPGGPLPPKRR